MSKGRTSHEKYSIAAKIWRSVVCYCLERRMEASYVIVLRVHFTYEKSFVWLWAFWKFAPHVIPDVIKRLKVCIFSVIEILTVKKPFRALLKNQSINAFFSSKFTSRFSWIASRAPWKAQCSEAGIKLINYCFYFSVSNIVEVQNILIVFKHFSFKNVLIKRQDGD